MSRPAQPPKSERRKPGTRRLKPIHLLDLIARDAQPKRRNEALFRLLRAAAQDASWQQPQPFYSIRTVATHFHFPRIAVSRVFNRLKTEGILTISWGSKTIIQAVQLDRQLHVRGVIAIVVPIELFGRDHACRELIDRLANELWKLRFVARFWFFEPNGKDPLGICQSIIKEKPDAIILVMLPAREKMLEQRLTDGGVRIVTISEATLRSRQFQPGGREAAAIARRLVC